MNKNIFKTFLTFAAAALIFVSCTEDVLKSDYDYTPIATEVPSDVVTVEVSDTGVVNATVSGSVEADSSLLDWGVIYYTADMLVNNTYLTKTAKDTSYNFTFSVIISGLVPNTNYFTKTYALNENGLTLGAEKPFKTKPAKELPFNLLASDAVATWQSHAFTHIDADGDTQKWGLAYMNAPLNTEVGLRSYSWFNAALTPENYVILPPVKLGSAQAKIDLDVQAFDATYFAEKFKVLIATSPIATVAQAKAAQVLYTEKLGSPLRATKSINIPTSFSGQVVWIGICHFETSDEYAIGVTNIKVY